MARKQQHIHDGVWDAKLTGTPTFNNEETCRAGMDSMICERKELRMAEAARKYRGVTRKIAVAPILIVTVVAAGGLAGQENASTVVLRESARAGLTTRVHTELKAKGLHRPGIPPGEVKMPKPLVAEIETRFIFYERLVEVDSQGTTRLARVDQPGAAAARSDVHQPRKAVRHVVEAGLAVNGEVRMISALLRPEVRLLVAERPESDGPVVVISPAGPLTWDELQLVQGLGDPLTLGDLLPEKPVAVGEHWRVRNSGAVR